MQIEVLTPALVRSLRVGLILLLRECVQGGASLGFLLPLPDTEASAFWDEVESEITAGRRVVLAARDAAGVVAGSGQLVPSTRANGRHRAEISKLLVLPQNRGKGLGSRIMAALEAEARRRSIRLLHLDTSEGRGGAMQLYEKLGYTYVGGIPEWALDPEGTPVKNAIYYKLLE